MIIGLAVTREGIPVRVWCWPGNTSDVTVLPEVRDGMRDWKLGRVVTVVDRGFSSNANLDYLRRGGGHWIAGERMRDHAGDAAQALSRQGRFTVVNEHLHVKEAKLDSTPGVRWIICLNTAEAVKDKTTRDEAVTRLEIELARISEARAKASAALKTTSSVKTRSRLEAELAGHTRTECALRDHVTLGRWLRQTPTGRLVIDRARIAAEAKLDGKYLLSTSDPHLTPAQVALGYKNLLEAERGFRDMKSTLMLRPVFHRLEPRIRAHVLICWLALLLVRVAENNTDTTWDRISRRDGPPRRGHPHRARRDRRPGHRTHRPPTRLSWGLQRARATPDHRPNPTLTCDDAPTRALRRRGHTTPSARTPENPH